MIKWKKYGNDDKYIENLCLLNEWKGYKPYTDRNISKCEYKAK